MGAIFVTINMMKNLIKAGSVIAGLSLIALAYNFFFNMYSLVAKCPSNIDLQNCQAYSSWKSINQIGLMLLILGIITIVIGFVKQQRKN
jgi:hypothetical protein